MKASSGDSPIDVSVVVCTYNRSDMLRDTLASWRRVDKSGCRCELIVVDNNSTDGTRDIVRSFQGTADPGPVYVFEGQPGLSFARNAGIAAAGGAGIAFVDDDVYFDQNWLRAIHTAFADHPAAMCLGGNSIPHFETERPDWLTDSMIQLYGSTLSGDAEKQMIFPEHPFGVNMAFRRRVFDLVGPFNTGLGRIKTSLLSNEEKELFYRIDRAGLTTVYIPDAIIHHRIPADRVDQQWVLKRLFWQGISKVAFNQLIERRGRVALAREALRHLKYALVGHRPFAVGKALWYYRRHPFQQKMKTALSLGIARQSLAELFAPGGTHAKTSSQERPCHLIHR